MPRVAIALVAWIAAGCHQPEHEGPMSGTGGEGRPCTIAREGGSSTGAEAEVDAVYRWAMKPGVAAEVDVDLGAGGWMGAWFEAPGTPLDWDIHTHEGDEVIVHASGRDTSTFAEHRAQLSDLYSFYLRNPGPADAVVCLELALEGDAALHPR